MKVLLISITIIVAAFVTLMIMYTSATQKYTQRYTRADGEEGDFEADSHSALLQKVQEVVKSDPNKAIKLIKRLLVEDAQDHELRMMMVEILLKQHKYAEAIRHLEYLAKELPTKMDVLKILAKSYQDYGLNNKAAEVYEKIVKLDNKDYDALQALAKLYVNTSQPKQASAVYKQLLAIVEPQGNVEEAIEILKTLAQLNESINNMAEAAAAYEKLFSYNQNDLELLKVLKDIFRKLGNFEKSIFYLDKLIEVNELDFALFEELILLLYKNGLYNEVLEKSKLIKNYKNADISSIQNIVAKVYIKTERYAEGIEILNEILKVHPTNIYLKQTLALAYKLTNEFDKAIEIYLGLIDIQDAEKSKILKSNLSSIFCTYGIYMYKKGFQVEAFDKFNAALNYDKANAEVYYQIGACHLDLKNFSDAYSNLQRAIELDPKKVAYKLTMADLYLGMDNLIDAMKNYNEILKQEPNNIPALAGTGKILAKQLQPDKAILNFKKVLELQPENVEIRYNLALAYEYILDKKAAMQEYEKILELEPGHESAANNLAHIKANLVE